MAVTQLSTTLPIPLILHFMVSVSVKSHCNYQDCLLSDNCDTCLSGKCAWCLETYSCASVSGQCQYPVTDICPGTHSHDTIKSRQFSHHYNPQDHLQEQGQILLSMEFILMLWIFLFIVNLILTIILPLPMPLGLTQCELSLTSSD